MIFSTIADLCRPSTTERASPCLKQQSSLGDKVAKAARLKARRSEVSVSPPTPNDQLSMLTSAKGGFNFNRLLMGGAVWFGINFLVGQMTKKTQTGVPVTDPNTGNLVTVAGNTGEIPPYQFRPNELNEGATYRHVPKMVAPIWPQDSHVDIVVTLSPSFNPTPISKTPEEYVVMQEKEFHINNYTDTRIIDTTFTVPKAVQKNATLWGHFYIGLSGSSLDPKEPGFDPGKAFHFAYPLTQYLPKKKVAKTRNLLDDLPAPVEEEEEEDTGGPIIANYYHPNASFSFVPDLGVKDLAHFPPAAQHFLRLESTGARDGTGQNGWYCKLSTDPSLGPLIFGLTWIQIPCFSSTLSGSSGAT